MNRATKATPIRIALARRLPVSVRDGFDYITDPDNWPEYWPRLVRITHAGRWRQPGDRARLVLRMLGREVELEMQLTRIEPYRLVEYTSEQRGLPAARHWRHFDQAGDILAYRIAVEYQPRPGWRSIFDRFLVRRAIERTLRETTANLERRFHERSSTAQAGEARYRRNPMATTMEQEQARDALVERVFGAALGAFDLMGVYLGDRLGLYKAMVDAGPLTATELSDRAGIAERYAREWLEQQAMSRILAVDDEAASDAERRYELPATHVEPLTDEASLAFIAPLAQTVIACARPLPALMSAYRSGEGVPFADYGEDLIDSQARLTGPMFDRLLAHEWLGAIASVKERLTSDPPARVADIACGEGRSSLAIARGYPKARVDGIDLDEASIDKANANLIGSGLEERVRFHRRDAADPHLTGTYDLVLIFESLHDMSHPVDALSAARAMLAEGGCVVIGDERVADRFSLDAGDVERFYYGCSITHCLPVGMIGTEPAGTGTVMRTETVRRYATEALFGHVEVLPIEHDFYRFYKLTA